MNEPITRDDYQFRREVLERLTRLETILTPLANGRIDKLESEMRDIQRHQERERGVAFGISFVVSALVAFFRAHIHLP